MLIYHDLKAPPARPRLNKINVFMGEKNEHKDQNELIKLWQNYYANYKVYFSIKTL